MSSDVLSLFYDSHVRRHLRSAASHQLVVPSQLVWSSRVLCTRSETVELFA